MIGVVQHNMKGHDVADAIAQTRHVHGDAIAAFHRVWHAATHTHGMTFFEGVPVIKNPLDLWIYSEILWDLRPTLLIETGTAYGGSALFYARTFDRIGDGHVVTIDIEPARVVPEHSRISYVKGYSSTDPDLLTQLTELAAGHPRVMVSLDSNHEAWHVTRELACYAPLVTAAQFLVVEDTDLNGRPVEVGWQKGPGPGPAVDAWLPDHPEFVRAPLAERYLISSHTWLRRRSATDPEERHDVS